MHLKPPARHWFSRPEPLWSHGGLRVATGAGVVPRDRIRVLDSRRVRCLRAADGTCLAKVGSCATVVTILDWMASVAWQFFWSSASTPRPGRSSTASSV